MNNLQFKTSEVVLAKRGAYSLSKYLYKSYSAKEERCIAVSEGVKRTDDFAQDNKGGIITFSTDVNATDLSENKLINFLKQEFTTLLNKFSEHKNIDAVAQTHNPKGWTVGHYISGRYTAENEKTYGEDSLSVEIIGVDSENLKNIAEELCIKFSQDSALIKDYSKNSVYLLNEYPF